MSVSVVTDTSKEVSLSCFLGETSNAQPGDIVSNLVWSYKCVINVALDTIARLQSGKVPDPTVGENACQLRAVIYAEILNAADFEQTLIKTQRILEIALQNLEKATLPEKKAFISLDKFLTDNQADAPIDERIHLLVLGRILEKTRAAQRGFSRDGNESIQLWETIEARDELKEVGFSAAAIRRLEGFSKKALSKHSVKILQGLARDLPPTQELQRLCALVSGDNVKTTNLGYETVPCFSSAQIWLDFICRQQTPLILRVCQVDADTAEVAGREPFFFKSNGKCYECVKKDAVLDRRAAVFIDAVSIAKPVLTREELQAELGKREIKETILAFIATHPVYGGDCKNEPGPIEEDEVRELYAEKAREWGCCPQNPRVCRLFHTYAVFTADWERIA